MGEARTRLKGKSLVMSVVLVVAFLTAYCSFCLRASTPVSKPEVETQNPTVSEADGVPLDFFPVLPDNPDYKPPPYYGLKGYLTITAAPSTQKSPYMKKGESVTLTILLHLVPLVTNFTEAHVNIDPNSRFGLKIEVGYSGGSVDINKLVSYDPSGNLTIKAGETVPVKMTIATLEDIPILQEFYLNAVGLSADVPIVDNLGVIAHG